MQIKSSHYGVVYIRIEKHLRLRCPHGDMLLESQAKDWFKRNFKMFLKSIV